MLSSYLVILASILLCYPMIIAVLGEKGGTGKTTLATNLAGMRAAANRDVLIIDADRQGSASYWTEKRDDLHASLPTVHCVQKFGNGSCALCAIWHVVMMILCSTLGREIVEKAKAHCR